MGILDDAFSAYNGGDNNGILAFYNRLMDELRPGQQGGGGAPQGWTPPGAMGAATGPRIPYTPVDEQAGAPQAAPQGAPAGMPQQSSSGPDLGNLIGGLGKFAGGVGDRLGAGVFGALSSGSPAGALGNLLGGLMSGQRTDPYGQQMRQQQAIFQQIVKAGGDPAQAAVIAQSPKAQELWIAQQIQPKKKLQETGTDPLTGAKSFAEYNENRGTLTPLPIPGASGGGAPNPDQLAAKINTLRAGGATQDQLLNEIPAGWRNYVSSILKSGAIPTNLGRNSQARSILMDYAHIIDPNFDETQLLERKTFAQGMGDTKNPAAYGGQLQSAGTVVKHLGDAYDQLGALEKGALAPTDTLNVLNPAKSYVRDQMGDQAFQDAKGHWDIVKKGISGELERLLSGRGGAESSKQYWLDKLDFNNGPTKIRAALDEARSLMMGRVENVALAKDRAYGGPTDPLSLFGPKEQNIMGRIAGGTFAARQAASSADTGPVRVASPAEARKLPKGTKIVLPDGSPGVVP